jgi:hypothetical protein
MKKAIIILLALTICSCVSQTRIERNQLKEVRVLRDNEVCPRRYETVQYKSQIDGRRENHTRRKKIK